MVAKKRRKAKKFTPRWYSQLPLKWKRGLWAAGAMAIVGIVVLAYSYAATTYGSGIEAKNANTSGRPKIVSDPNASGAQTVASGLVGTTPTPTPTPSPTPSNAPAPTSSITCKYQSDTWSGDAPAVGYNVSELPASNGNPASFSVRLNAHSNNTEVVGYPSDQCLMYSALPSSLTSSLKITPPASSAGLDYEFAYDIWLTTATAAESNNWNNDLELMIWTYNHGQTPAGSVTASLSDGSKVWVAGNNTTGTVSVVMPQNETSGTINISGVIGQLKSLGYITSADNGILDVEYGIEAPYGGGQTFAVNSISVAE